MQKAKPFALGFRQSRPVGSRFLQQTESAVDVGANEIVGTMNRPVHVAFGCKMHNSARALALQKGSYQVAFDDIALLKPVRRVLGDGFKIARIPGIGQFVEIQDGRCLLYTSRCV